MKSAVCTLRHGAFLALENAKGDVVPIESVWLSDDYGEALAANLYAFFFRLPLSWGGMVRLNFLINALGIISLTLVLWRARFICAAAAALWAGGWWGFPGPFPTSDISTGFLGMFCLSLIFPMWLLSASERQAPWPLWLIEGTISSVALYWAIFFRQQFGLIALGCSVVVYIARVLLSKTISRTRQWGLLGLLIVAASGPAMTFKWRDHLWSFPSTAATRAHGIWHALYLGLGTTENPWGIRWDDSKAANAVLARYPETRYLTPDYFSKVRILYCDLVRNHPVRVLRLYADKTVQLFRLPLHVLGIQSFGILFLSGCCWLMFMRRFHHSTLWQTLGIILTAGLALGLQGIFIMPHAMYLWPASFAAVVVIGLWADWLLYPRGPTERM